MLMKVILCMLSINMLALIPEGIRAADENMDSAVYLTFDPATGQFTSATKDLSAPPETDNGAVQQGHEGMSQQASSGETSLNAVTANTVTPTSAAETEDGGSRSTIIVIVGAIALLVLGAIGFIMRKGQSKQLV